jgi:hypothetical protein
MSMILCMKKVIGGNVELPEESKYLDILKVIELGTEGGSEILYRLLPFGSAQFIWRTYGTSIGESETGDEEWSDFGDEYEDIAEYLLKRSQMLIHLIPLYIDTMYRDQVFHAVVDSFRQYFMLSNQGGMFEDTQHGPVERNWHYWQEHLKIPREGTQLVIYPTFGPGAFAELRLNYDAIPTVQSLLNITYQALLAGQVPQGSYGKAWQLFDVVGAAALVLPRDDRAERLRAKGILPGSRYFLVPK